MEMVTLRTGVEHTRGLFATMHLVCRDLMERDALAIFDAVSLARDSSYRPFGSNGVTLEHVGLLESDGSMSRSVRELLLAFFEGEGLKLVLLPPSECVKSTD